MYLSPFVGPHASEERTGCAPGARTSVSARCPFLRRPAPRWAENNLDRPSQCLRWASIRAHRSRGPRNRVAGGRTSVSAPMGILGKPPCQWAENQRGSAQPPSPMGIQRKTTVRMDQTTAPRERGPLCPPAAHLSEDPRPAGQKTNLDRPSPHPLVVHPSTPSPWAQKQVGGGALAGGVSGWVSSGGWGMGARPAHGHAQSATTTASGVSRSMSCDSLFPPLTWRFVACVGFPAC